MRRLLLSCLVLVLVPALLGVARSERTSEVKADANAVAAPSAKAASVERLDAHERAAERWAKAHPVKAPLRFDWPAEGSITGVYGNDDGRRHPGIDIGTLRSLKVRAAAAGRVLHTGYAPGYDGYGKVVVVRSGKLQVLYAHLSRVEVRPGELVHRDERLGTAGCTGYCTGTHLHFEIRRDGHTVDPMRMLANAS
jgi:murein DD-endopeptidase MepM/ murein hydrolase activator NlpD